MTRIALVFVLPLAGLFVLAPFILTGLRSAMVSGNEASAIGSVRMIVSGQATFSAWCANGPYAPSLAALGIPEPERSVAFVDTEQAQAWPRTRRCAVVVRIPPR